MNITTLHKEFEFAKGNLEKGNLHWEDNLYPFTHLPRKTIGDDGDPEDYVNQHNDKSLN